MDALMANYARLDIAFERGEGPYLFTTEGSRYLDFGAGIAVTALGHAHPKLVAALTGQASRLWHTSNLYRIGPQERLAERLVEHTFAERVFFCNSGAEASEGVIKTVRRFHHHQGNPERTEIIVTEGAFHGRTLGGLAAGGNEAHREGFGPVAGGFIRVPHGDVDAARAAVSERTAGALVEPLQGESGIIPAPQGYLSGLRDLCDASGILLALDEVQTGIGRTGRLLACEWDDVSPDVVGLAKGLGGGFPIGAVLATERAAAGMVPGTHGSTFGGNFLASAVADAVVEEIMSPGFLGRVERSGEHLRNGLERLQSEHPGVVSDVRGRGLMLGMTAVVDATDLYNRFRDHKLLTIPAAGGTVRMLPPLNLEPAHIDEALAITEAVFRTFR